MNLRFRFRIFPLVTVAAAVAASAALVVAGLSPAAQVAALPPGVAAVGPPAKPTNPSVRVWSSCIDLINQQRQAAGKAPVAHNLVVGSVATDQARFQAVVFGDLTHSGPNGSNAGQRLSAAGYQWITWGENVAVGQIDCADVVAAFMASPPHRANLLSSAVSSVGVGAWVGPNGARYWTILLTAPA